jgi:hypothetical protein
MAEAAKKETETVFFLHNVVRRQHTRLKRMQAAGRHRFKQYVGDVRLTRNRPRPVKESFVLDHLEQLKAMYEEGTVEVRNATGQLVDLETMKAAPLLPVKPQPHPPLDSAANDDNQGVPVPVYQEGKGHTEEAKVPSLALEDIPEGFDPEEEAPEEVAEAELMPEPEEPKDPEQTKSSRKKKGSSKK